MTFPVFVLPPRVTQEPAAVARPTVLISSRDGAAVPHVAGVARLEAAARTAGWTVRSTYALAACPATKRRAAHRLHSIAVRLARGEVTGWAVWYRVDDAPRVIDGIPVGQRDWRFRVAWLYDSGKSHDLGLRELMVRVSTP